MDIGTQIIAIRKEKGISQSQLGKAVGVSREMIGKYERNDTMPSIEIAKRIADALDTSLDYLTGASTESNLDEKAFKMMQAIETLNEDAKDKLYFLVNAVIRDTKTQETYS